MSLLETADALGAPPLFSSAGISRLQQQQGQCMFIEPGFALMVGFAQKDSISGNQYRQ